jgi:hypothetical protein
MTFQVATVDEVRKIVANLPRSYEVVVRGRVKFRVGQIVYIAFSRDETQMGFAFPKEERDALVQTYPEKFRMPRESDLRFNWVVAHLDRLEEQELREFVLDAWRMVVPKFLARASDEELLAYGGNSGGQGTGASSAKRA